MNLAIDLRNLVATLWPDAEFLSLELLTVAASCKLRRIATMRSSPADTTEDDVALCCDRTLWQTTPVEPLPRGWEFAPSAPAAVTQVFHMSKLRAFEALARGGNPEEAAAAAGGTGSVAAEQHQQRERGRTAPSKGSGSGSRRNGGAGSDHAGPTVLAFGRRLPQKDTPGPLPSSRGGD
eukprot:SAG31_NODE_1363_length_8627_cov_5.967402_10_plen_179_part_00